MLSYFLRKTASSLLLLWGVLSLSFLLLHLAPGDPVDLMIDPSVPAEDARLLRESFGLDRSIGGQYLSWMGNLLQGDFGVSFRQQRPVSDILAEAIPATLRLSILALLLHYLVGTALGVIAATRRATLLDRGLTLGSLALYSLPTFWLALMAQLLFCWKLGWLPSGGMPQVAFEASDPGPWLGAQVRHSLLPVMVLGLSGAAGVARYVRSSMLEVLQQDYIRNAHARGLTPGRVLWVHALRNAAIPLMSLVGLGLPFLLSGSVVIEVIFSWPGMGRVAVDAIFARDYPLILAATVVSGSLVILGSWLADIGYAALDPRIRLRQ